MKSSDASQLQLDVDIIAVFIEVVEELRREPFFDVYETTITHSSGDKLVEVEMGDRFHFRSALIPFRRIWRCGEDSHYADVLGLIGKYDPSQATIASIESFCSAHKNLEQRTRRWPVAIDVTGKDLVDGWLYSVFIHSNLRKTRQAAPGSYNRLTFEHWVETYGHAALECAFRETVREAGWLYFRIADSLAYPLHKYWLRHGNVARFSLASPFGRSKREKLPDGTVLIRRSTSLYGVDETLTQKFHRLLRRFRNLGTLMNDLKMTPEELLKVTVASRNIRDLVDQAGFEMHVAEYYVPPPDNVALHKFFDDKTQQMCNVILTGERVIVADRNAIRAWSRDFYRFKEVLASREREDITTI